VRGLLPEVSRLMNCPTCNKRVEPFRAECDACGQDIDWSGAFDEPEPVDEPLPPAESDGLDGVVRAGSYAGVFLLGWLLAALTVDYSLTGAGAWQAALETGLLVDHWDVLVPPAFEIAIPGLTFAFVVFGLDLVSQRRWST